MTKATKLSKERSFGLPEAVLLIAEVILLIISGGFFEETVILMGIAMIIICVWKLSRIRISVSKCLFLIFSLWYFICSIKDGFVLEYAARGLIPIVVFIFWIFLSGFDINREKLTDILLEISMWIALAAVIHCIIASAKASNLIRLRFPFDYPNACGIFFAVCYFSAEKSKSRFINKIKYLFLLSLVLTQSVGSIGIFALVMVYKLILHKKYIKLILSAAVLTVFVILFRERAAESAGTFLERLLHIYDGILCIWDNPVFGIGAGRWEIAKQYYQTGFYSANTIHSSITQIGVNSGIIGMGLFLAAVTVELRRCIADKKDILIPVMILAHSLLDFTLSFTAISVFLLLLYDTDSYGRELEIKPIAKRFAGSILALSFGFFAFGLYNSASFQKNISEGKSVQSITERYNKSYTLKKSLKSVKSYAAFLYTEKYYDVNTPFENYKYLPVEIILYESLSEEKGRRYLIDQLNKQQYNTALRDIITKEFQGNTADEANRIVSNAADTASYFGKILYKLKGENL